VKLKKKTKATISKRVKHSKIELKTPAKKKKKKPYFGKDAHNSIVEYQAAETRKEKHKIYIDQIKPSFEKLSENLIFIHGFSKSRPHFELLKADCVSFLYETLEKFDPARGSKAFSYFNVCAKNFLIIQSKKRLKNEIRHVSIDDQNLSIREKNTIEQHQVVPSQEDVFIREEDKLILLDLVDEIHKKLSNQNEIECIKAVKILFENIDDLDFLNKRAIFVYLREISGLSPKQLSVAMSNIRKHYRELVKGNFEFVLFK